MKIEIKDKDKRQIIFACFIHYMYVFCCYEWPKKMVTDVWCKLITLQMCIPWVTTTYLYFVSKVVQSKYLDSTDIRH